MSVFAIAFSLYILSLQTRAHRYTQTFPKILGPGLTARLLHLSDTVRAAELVPSGFIADLIPGPDILKSVVELLEKKLPRLAQLSIQANKGLVRNAETRKELHAANERELAVLEERYVHEDSLSALRRFKADQEAKKNKDSRKSKL
jgi:enoyl-CoA hydratase/carnithine racemase